MFLPATRPAPTRTSRRSPEAIAAGLRRNGSRRCPVLRLPICSTGRTAIQAITASSSGFGSPSGVPARRRLPESTWAFTHWSPPCRRPARRSTRATAASRISRATDIRARAESGLRPSSAASHASHARCGPSPRRPRPARAPGRSLAPHRLAHQVGAGDADLAAARVEPASDMVSPSRRMNTCTRSPHIGLSPCAEASSVGKAAGVRGRRPCWRISSL